MASRERITPRRGGAPATALWDSAKLEQASPKYSIAETLHDCEGIALYRAVSSADRRAVILKVLDPRRCGPAALARQRREYEVGRALDLATVVRPLALDTYQGMPALVLEDSGGKPLDRVA